MTTRSRRGARLGTLTPEALAERLSQAIEDAYDWESTAKERLNGEVPARDIESAIGHWQYGITKAFESWGCDSDDCPGRPAWESALGEAVFGDADHQELQERMADVMRAWLMERLLAFAAAHPEARLAP